MNNNEPYSARFGDGSDVDDLIYGDDRNISQRLNAQPQAGRFLDQQAVPRLCGAFLRLIYPVRPDKQRPAYRFHRIRR